MSDLVSPSAALVAQIRALTSARVGLARTGVSQTTRDLLDFQRAHAQARDAVHAVLDSRTLAAEIAALTHQPVLRLQSAAKDRATYLRRPDLGRTLDAENHSRLQPGDWDLAIVIADGLSAIAIERNVLLLLRALLPQLDGWRIAPICVVEQGRVAIGDEIGEALGAKLSVVLIGERPGLSSPDSLGIYITWAPRLGRTDAERNCISNVREGGLSYAEAAAQLLSYITAARQQHLTGVALKCRPAKNPEMGKDRGNREE